MDKSEQKSIFEAVKCIVKIVAPKAGYADKYGGEVILPNPEDDKRMVGGIFAYDKHVTLEFSEGSSFEDPDGLLEGNGKKRRHLKFQRPEDVEMKNAEYFLKQALLD